MPSLSSTELLPAMDGFKAQSSSEITNELNVILRSEFGANKGISGIRNNTTPNDSGTYPSSEAFTSSTLCVSFAVLCGSGGQKVNVKRLLRTETKLDRIYWAHDHLTLKPS